MSASVIAYELLDRVAGESNLLWQYDYGQKMKLTGVDLPMSYTVHFSNSSRGASIPSIGDASGVSIPDQVLLTGKPVYFWLFLHIGENDGQTAYANIINVHPRANLPEIDPPDPEQQSILDELMAALNAGILHVDEIAEGIPDVVDEEIAAAKERGEFKGDPGAVFTPSIVDGVMIWSNDGGLPNPEPTDFNRELGLDNFATKQELAGKVDNGRIGQPNGVAALDETGHVPSELLPSYVDDIVEYPSVSQFPAVGETGKIYISTSNNHWYRWTGSQYFDMTGADASLKADKRDTILETTLSRGRHANSTVGTGSFAFGSDVVASGDYSFAEGGGNFAEGEFSHAEGYSTIASGIDAHSEGYGTHATGHKSHAENSYTWATGLSSHAEGYYSQATGDYSHSEASNTHATGDASHAEGSYTNAGGFASHAEGKFTTTYSDGAHSEGSYTVASSPNSHAEGCGGMFTNGSSEYQSGAYGETAHSEGNHTRAEGTGAHSEGEYTVANAKGAHAEGFSTRALGYAGSHAEGSYTLASDDNAHAEGNGTIAENDAAHAEGNNTTASGMGAHSEGYMTIASGDKSHSEGDNAKAIGASSHAEGGGTQAVGTGSHAEGGGSRATGNYSHSEGGGTTASGDNSHSEGSGTTASGGNSHAEGGGTYATGNYSHAEGTGTHATGDYSHTEGGGTTASGADSHAEGGGTQANAVCSHAEGASTQANGLDSHAEGAGTQAEGFAAHSEGTGTHADGDSSHAEGFNALAIGSYSHAGGYRNLPDEYDNDRWPEWVQGEHCVPGDKRKRTRIVDEQTVVEGFVCTVENTDSDWDDTHWDNQYGKMNYAVIVGNGYGNDRSNAYCLDWDGNGHFAGDVYIGCNPDGTGGTKLELVPFATDAETMSIFESA